MSSRCLPAAIAFLLLAVPKSGPAQVAGTDTTAAYLSVESSTLGYDLFLDETYIGKTPLFAHRVRPGKHLLVIRRTATNSWMMTDWTREVLLAAGDTVRIVAHLKRPYMIRSYPFGANVYQNRKLLGQTPVIVELPDTAAYTLVIVKPGYDPSKIVCSPEGAQFFNVALQENAGRNVDMPPGMHLAGRRKNRIRRNTFILAGVTAAAGIAAILLNNKANDSYEKYQQEGNPASRERFFDQTEKYDRYSGVALGIFQVNLALSFYFFYKANR